MSEQRAEWDAEHERRWPNEVEPDLWATSTDPAGADQTHLLTGAAGEHVPVLTDEAAWDEPWADDASLDDPWTLTSAEEPGPTGWSADGEPADPLVVRTSDSLEDTARWDLDAQAGGDDEEVWTGHVAEPQTTDQTIDQTIDQTAAEATPDAPDAAAWIAPADDASDRWTLDDVEDQPYAWTDDEPEPVDVTVPAEVDEPASRGEEVSWLRDLAVGAPEVAATEAPADVAEPEPAALVDETEVIAVRPDTRVDAGPVDLANFTARGGSGTASGGKRRLFGR
jgi:hypothetical protein